MEAGADVNAANLKVMSIMVALANRGLSEELLFDPALAQSGLVDVLPLPNVRAPLSLLSFLSFLSFLSPLPNVRAPPLSPLSPLVPLAALSQPRFLVGLRAGGPRFSASPFSPSSPHLAPVGAPQIQRHVWRGPAGLGERADLGRGGRLGAHARQPPAAGIISEWGHVEPLVLPGTQFSLFAVADVMQRVQVRAPLALPP